MYIVIGGTFDRFHAGHEFFLDKAFESGEKVLIGLTTHSMLKKLVRKDSIWSFQKRKKTVRDFVRKYGKEFEIMPIEDIFGPATGMKDLDAIVATEETLPTCERINELRKKKRLKPLRIILLPYVYSEDCRVISSSRIRKEEIDRQGKVLIDYKITDRLREELRIPIGKIIEGENKPVTEDLASYIKKQRFEEIICVGDVVSRDMIEHGLKPKNVVIDGKVNKQPIDYKDFILKSYAKRFLIDNPPGMISREVWRTMIYAFKTKSAVVVRGEEDLLAIPAVLLAKNNSAVIYGQPHRGKVILRIDEDRKEKVRKVLEGFKIIKKRLK
jgi:pantetheine-phosphate adenylyltransferase